jgi:predicted Rossmann fold nucleotide-binding protein DprA/Smf involved in DNA uptake
MLGMYRCGGAKTFHHGDAEGADRQAAKLARQVGLRVVKHPPKPPGTAKELLARNRDIVAAVDVLLATPRTAKEVLRSGTWATIRYARKAHVRVLLLEP